MRKWLVYIQIGQQQTEEKNKQLKPNQNEKSKIWKKAEFKKANCSETF